MACRIKRKILLPESIDDKLQNLVELQQETNGVFLYVPEPTSDGFDCGVDALYMTAVGTAGHVEADTKRMAIVNRFFQNNPEYQFVKWHTHCRGTGEYWFTRFSQRDISAYEAQLRDESRFIGMMISPVRKLIYGRGELDFALVPDTEVSQRRERQVQRELKRAASELGYNNLPPLRTTR